MLGPPDSSDHVCQSDQFVVSGGPPIPAICGTNTGQHRKYRTCEKNSFEKTESV